MVVRIAVRADTDPSAGRRHRQREFLRPASKNCLAKGHPEGGPSPHRTSKSDRDTQPQLTAPSVALPFNLYHLCAQQHVTPPAKVRIADSSSRNAVNFSSACTTKRFPLSRCASAIQIVRPLESIAETQPQLQPALLRLSAIISQYFILRRAWHLLRRTL